MLLQSSEPVCRGQDTVLRSRSNARVDSTLRYTGEMTVLSVMFQRYLYNSYIFIPLLAALTSIFELSRASESYPNTAAV